MATIALSVAGNAIAPGVGGFIGATVGAAIDNFLIFPAVFPTPTQVGPRIADRQLQTASEGADAKWAIGPRVPVAGTVIWMGDLIEEPSTVNGGKKSADVTLYKYYRSVAVAVCDTSDLPDGRISKVVRILANEKVIYGSGALSRCRSITVYRGDQTSPDPVMEAAVGAGKSPDHRGIAYVVLERLALEEIGRASCRERVSSPV